MKKTNLIIAIFLTLLFLNACSTVSEGLGGSKKKGSDEFLVEKKAPLVLPPSFGELPEPEKKTDENVLSTKEDISSIGGIINESSSSDISNENNDLNNSIEKSIIEKINKKKIKAVNLDEVIEEKTKMPKKKSFFKKLREKFSKQ